MSLRKFYELKGKHAKLSPSQAGRWAVKDLKPDDIFRMINSSYAQQIGTLLHAYAEQNIKYCIKMIKSDKKEVRKFLLQNGLSEKIVSYYIDQSYDNLMAYTNDAIGFRMEPEVELCYSATSMSVFKLHDSMPPIFGTADAICFRNNLLRIHDLKTGVLPAHMEQLLTYAALFCLQERIKPGQIDIELRIYQSNEIIVHNPAVDEILPIMDRIIAYDKMLTKYLLEE